MEPHKHLGRSHNTQPSNHKPVTAIIIPFLTIKEKQINKITHQRLKAETDYSWREGDCWNDAGEGCNHMNVKCKFLLFIVYSCNLGSERGPRLTQPFFHPAHFHNPLHSVHLPGALSSTRECLCVSGKLSTPGQTCRTPARLQSTRTRTRRRERKKNIPIDAFTLIKLI